MRVLIVVGLFSLSISVFCSSYICVEFFIRTKFNALVFSRNTSSLFMCLFQTDLWQLYGDIVYISTSPAVAVVEPMLGVGPV